MNTHAGYSKQNLDANYLLKANGGDAAFRWSLELKSDNTTIEYQPLYLWGGRSVDNYYAYDPLKLTVGTASQLYYAELTATDYVTSAGATITSGTRYHKVMTASGVGIPSLYKGLMVVMKMPSTGRPCTGCTVNIDGKGAVGIRYYNTGDNYGYWNANYRYLFVYDGTYFQAMSAYDTNTDCRYLLRQFYYRNKVASDGVIRRYTLCMQTPGGQITSLTTTDNNIGTTKTMYSGNLLIGKIYYWGTDTNYAAGANIAINNVMFELNGDLIDYRYTFNCGLTLTANSVLYLVGTINASTKYFKLDSTPWSCSLPTTDDNKVYIKIGIVYPDSSPYRGTLEVNNTAYIYKQGKIWEYNEYANYAAKLIILDIRSANRLPSYFPNRTLFPFFNNTGMPTSDWYSGMTVKGWDDGYASWQLASYSSTGTAAKDLYFRCSNNHTAASSSWQSWVKLSHSGNTYFGTASNGQIPLTINGTTKNLSLQGHTHDLELLPRYDDGLMLTDYISTDIIVDGDIYVPTMTSSLLGVAKLFSSTVLTIAANSVTASAGRTYGIQVNSSGQLVVNVPWSNTATYLRTQASGAGTTLTTSGGTGIIYALTTFDGSVNALATALAIKTYYGDPDDYFKYRGEIPSAYVNLATYTANATNYLNPKNGVYYYAATGHNEMFISFSGSGSTSGLEFKTNYSTTEPIMFRHRIDSNRVDGAWRKLLYSNDRGLTAITDYSAKVTGYLPSVTAATSSTTTRTGDYYVLTARATSTWNSSTSSADTTYAYQLMWEFPYAKYSLMLRAISPNSEANKLYYYSGQPTIETTYTTNGRAYPGSSSRYNWYSFPILGNNGTTNSTYTSVNNNNSANIMNLRMQWSTNYFHDLFASPNTLHMWHRHISNGTAGSWHKFVDDGNLCILISGYVYRDSRDSSSWSFSGRYIREGISLTCGTAANQGSNDRTRSVPINITNNTGSTLYISGCYVSIRSLNWLSNTSGEDFYYDLGSHATPWSILAGISTSSVSSNNTATLIGVISSMGVQSGYESCYLAGGLTTGGGTRSIRSVWITIFGYLS